MIRDRSNIPDIATAGSQATPTSQRLGWDFRVFPALSIVAGLNVAATLLVVRRMSGGAIHGLSTSRLGIAIVIAAGLALLAREIFFRTSGKSESRAQRWCATLVCSSPLLALAFAAASWRFATACGGALLLTIVTAAAAYCWSSLRALWCAAHPAAQFHTKPARREEPREDVLAPTQIKSPLPLDGGGVGGGGVSAVSNDVRPPSPTLPPRGRKGEMNGFCDGEKIDLEPREDSLLVAEEVCRRISLARFITADGIDRMEGQTLAEFLPGQKHVTIHIAFCPPFARCPTFESTTDAAGVRIGTTAIYPYGARLELKRLQEVEVPLQVAIVFEASLQPPESAAA